MATSSSSDQKPRHLLNNIYMGPTSAPPPTPSTQPSLSTTSDAAETLSRLLHRLPPSLSLPTRRLSPRNLSTSSSSSSPLPTPSLSSMSSFELGYFQLTSHSIPPQLAESAELDSLSLFELPLEEKLSSFPKEWPFGFNYDDEDHDHDHHKTGSFCLDGQCSSSCSSTELKLTSLRELTRELEKLGLMVVEKLTCAMGVENPFRDEKSEDGLNVGPKYSSMMWVSSSDGDKGMRVYPYVVGLQYQIRPRKWDLLSDSGLVNVEPEVGSVLVTLGDIAQVWSNGKLKKVRGRPTPNPNSEQNEKSSLSMTLLLTLPLESTVSPLFITPNTSLNPNNLGKESNVVDNPQIDHDDKIDHDHTVDDQRIFNSFNFEDYAWRVYHERLQLKDPLDRYRIIDD
ncbi:unnamed protein product [Amaranthus hypochondriacus]